jgi:hypothetical protein
MACVYLKTKKAQEKYVEYTLGCINAVLRNPTAHSLADCISPVVEEYGNNGKARW